MNTNKENILRKEVAVNPIYSITPFTLLDFPDKTACIIWFAGCNMRCSYCYNADIVTGKGQKSYSEALTFIYSRKNLLDGVVLSGGECTLHNGIIDFAFKIKEAGYSIKVDTNGSNPDVIKKLINNNLVDYVALDFKSEEKNFIQLTGSSLFKRFEKTLKLLINSVIPFEVRTTAHSSVFTSSDLKSMSEYLQKMNYKGKYYIQHFVNDVPTLEMMPYSNNDFVLNGTALEVEFRR